MYKVKNGLVPSYIADAYLLLPTLSIILEILISTYQDFGMLHVENVALLFQRIYSIVWIIGHF